MENPRANQELRKDNSHRPASAWLHTTSFLLTMPTTPRPPHALSAEQDCTRKNASRERLKKTSNKRSRPRETVFVGKFIMVSIRCYNAMSNDTTMTKTNVVGRGRAGTWLLSPTAQHSSGSLPDKPTRNSFQRPTQPLNNNSRTEKRYHSVSKATETKVMTHAI